MLVVCVVFSGYYVAGVVGEMAEAPFPPLEVLRVMVVLYGQREVQAPSDVSEQVLVGVTLLAP